MTQLNKKILTIHGTIKNYPWGSHQTLARQRGALESVEPEAELWFGDNPEGPSPVADSGLTLDRITSTLDPALPKGQLPFLAKILAVERALSLQVHPSLEDISELQNICKDQNHKPEMVVALTEFQAFVGFADINESLKLLEKLNSEKINDLLANPLRAGVPIKEILKNILGVEDTTGILDEVQKHLGQLDHIRGRWMRELIELYSPKLDPLATLLCELVILQPGESLYLPPKCVHAYLNGTVVEVMANSDNVIRGGLTHKPIDKKNFLKIIDAERATALRIHPTMLSSHREWKPPIVDFLLYEFQGEIDAELVVENYAIAFAWQGRARIAQIAQVAQSELPANESTHADVYHEVGALLAPGRYALSGSGSLWVATGKGR
jgi:mannose-6-phosphate isomerase